MQSEGDFITTYFDLKMMNRAQHHSPKKAKRFRSAFTTDQVNYLEKQFKKFPYIGNAHRKEVALSLNIPERAVKIWFQNRRMKEKKDGSNKEFDNLHNVPKALEFAKSQLKNASEVSANDQQILMRSLPLLNDVSQASYDNDMIKTNFTNNMTVAVDSGNNNTKVKITATAPQHVVTTKVIHPPTVFINGHSNHELKPSVNSIDLCKKLKTETYSKPYVQPMKKEAVTPKKLEHTSSPMEQTIPEDLSANRKPVYSPMIQPPFSNSGYVSIVPTVSPFYAQPYISASGVVWKPVNVMPMVSSPSPAQGNMYDIVPESAVNRSCNCDCHVNPQVTYNYSQQASPRYIITSMPFQNPSTKF